MTAKRIALFYFLGAVTWILVTDGVLQLLPGQIAHLISMVKDLIFVLTTSLVLFFVLARWNKRRRKVEDALRETNRRLEGSEQDLSAIIDNLPDAFYRTDPEGRILRMSRCGYEMLACHEGSLIGRNFSDFHADPDGRPKFLAALEEHKGRVLRYEAPFRREDGSIIWCSINARYAADALGNIIGVEGILRDVTEHHRLEQQLRHVARHDPLTGLLNRGAFMEQLNQALARARRNGGGLGLLFLDLDGFKSVNDGCGHHVGDQLLIEVANRLVDELRETDAAGRFGGDEFVLMLEGNQDLSTIAVAERLVENLRRPYALSGHHHRISVSIGIALFPENGASAEDLLRDADQAMYQAKQTGKNRFCLCPVVPVEKQAGEQA